MWCAVSVRGNENLSPIMIRWRSCLKIDSLLPGCDTSKSIVICMPLVYTYYMYILNGFARRLCIRDIIYRYACTYYVYILYLLVYICIRERERERERERDIYNIPGSYSISVSVLLCWFNIEVYESGDFHQATNVAYIAHKLLATRPPRPASCRVALLGSPSFKQCEARSSVGSLGCHRTNKPDDRLSL